MSTQTISAGTAHTLPDDLKKALSSNKAALAKWESLTPLARNEWICWTTFPKQATTRAEHVKRVVSELNEGMRRPCCWIGCIHRKDKKMSKSVQWVLSKQKRKP
ncbi:MAG: YdeI/OmpD-associated family protein [Candidatus Kerfeldbacteria bacterium]|nr:YdeI/OmpD-associated family protein [Candidatus Kerfeldbacteria bacterium]